MAGAGAGIGGSGAAAADRPDPRCVVTTLMQRDLPGDPKILRTIARHSAAASVTLAPGVLLPAVAGVYADVLATGTLREGDRLELRRGATGSSR